MEDFIRDNSTMVGTVQCLHGMICPGMSGTCRPSSVGPDLSYQDEFFL